VERSEETPFESIESAHEYVRLLLAEVARVRGGLADDVAAAQRQDASRRLDALRIVDYKLVQLEQNLRSASRILVDLRVLRRLLMGERGNPQT
jgi:hypothetical protein